MPVLVVQVYVLAPPAVNVAVLPLQIVAADVVAVTIGKGFTVINCCVAVKMYRSGSHPTQSAFHG